MQIEIHRASSYFASRRCGESTSAGVRSDISSVRILVSKIDRLVESSHDYRSDLLLVDWVNLVGSEIFLFYPTKIGCGKLVYFAWCTIITTGSL